MEIMRDVLDRARRCFPHLGRTDADASPMAEAAELAGVEGVLAHYLRSLWEVPVRIEGVEDPAIRRGNYLRRGREPRDRSTAIWCYTDGSALYLPGAVSLFPRHEANFAIYRGMATLGAAQMREGTLHYVRWFLPSGEKRLGP